MNDEISPLATLRGPDVRNQSQCMQAPATFDQIGDLRIVFLSISGYSLIAYSLNFFGDFLPLLEQKDDAVERDGVILGFLFTEFVDLLARVSACFSGGFEKRIHGLGRSNNGYYLRTYNRQSSKFKHQRNIFIVLVFLLAFMCRACCMRGWNLSSYVERDPQAWQLHSAMEILHIGLVVSGIGFAIQI